MKANSNPKKLVFITFLSIASFLLSACSISNVPASTTPKIDSFAIDRVRDKAKQVTLTAKVSDPDNDLKSVVIRWGDGTSNKVTSNFQAIQLTHSYGEVGKTYTVELEAEDSIANIQKDSRQIGVASIPFSCQKITEIEFCYDLQPDLLSVNVSVKAFNNTLYETSLSAAMPSFEFLVPLAGPVGQAKVKVTGSFSASGGDNSVNVQIFACTFGICIVELTNQKISF